MIRGPRRGAILVDHLRADSLGHVGMLQEAQRDAILTTQCLREVGFLVAQRVQGCGQRGRTLRRNPIRGTIGRLDTNRSTPLDDLRHRVGCESLTYPVSFGVERRCGRRHGVARQRGVDAVGDDGITEGVEILGRDVVVGEAHGDRVGTGQRAAGQRRVRTELVRHACEKECPADVRHEADTDLRHGQTSSVGDDARVAVRGDTDAATHHDSVHDRDVGLGIGRDVEVEAVLVRPEAAGRAVRGRGVVSPSTRREL